MGERKPAMTVNLSIQTVSIAQLNIASNSTSPSRLLEGLVVPERVTTHHQLIDITCTFLNDNSTSPLACSKKGA